MANTLTFGVELEFIAIFKRLAFSNKISGLRTIREDREHEYISATEAIHHCLEEHDIKSSNDKTFERWRVHGDILRPSPAEEHVIPASYFTESIEISSRKLRFSDNWQMGLKRVLSVLHWMRVQFSCEFITNASTGLHVHIGNDSGHSLRTAKRVAQIATIHERNLDALHSAERIFPLTAAPRNDLNKEVVWPLYAGLSFFHLSSENGNYHRHRIDFMSDIESSRTLAELGTKVNRVTYQDMGSCGHNCTLNFDNLYLNPYPNDGLIDSFSGTIEFRQHAGDLDSGEIISYIQFLATLTTFCMDASDEEVFALVANGMDLNFGLKDLLLFIECDSGIVQHFCARTPRNLTTASCTALQDFIDVNDRECAARRSPQAVSAAIGEKVEAGVYGISFQDPVSLGGEDYRWMLMCAGESMKSLTGISDAQRESAIRARTFRTLAQLYSALAKSNANDHATVVKAVLRPWIVRYGGSKCDN